MKTELKIKKFLAFEQKHDLFSYRIDGWSLWRVMRNSVFRVNRELPINSLNRPQLIRIFQAIYATLQLCVLILFARQSDLLVKTCQSGLRLKEGEKFKDIYFDCILPFYSYIKLEEKNNSEFNFQSRRAVYSSSLDPVVFTFWGRLLGLMFPVDKKDECNNISTLLQQELGVIVSPRFLLMRVSTVYWQAKLYGALLRRVKPKVVLVADTGEYALKVASSKLGIQMIELQHGVFDGDHPDAIPKWVNGSDVELLLPNVLACKGSFWIKMLSETRQGLDCAVPVGSVSVDTVRDTRQQIKNTKAQGRLRIVVTSQGLDAENLVSWLIELAALLEEGSSDWLMLVKLHPAYDSDQYHKYQKLTNNDRIEVILGHTHPSLFELLTEADVHLSISSASHFDALGVGVSSIVIPLTDSETMKKYTDNKNFFYAESPLQIMRIIESIGCVEEECSTAYSEPNFVENMRRLIDKI